MARFAAAPRAGLLDNKRGPKAPPRTGWVPRLGQVYHLQKAHPEAGAFRLWRLLAQPDISVRTVGRIRALNTLVYDDIPHGAKPGPQPTPQPHPYQAPPRHAYGVIDGRQLAFALDGGKWGSLLMLAGYSRPMLAGAIAPTEATWAALLVLDTAGRRDGAPPSLVSESGGA
jgi:hypothetical protein